MDWIARIFDFIFTGLPALAFAVFVIGMVYIFFRTFLENPFEMARRTIGVVLAIVIGFLAMPIFDKYIYPLNDWGMFVGYCGGWVLAFKIGTLVAGFKEDS